MRDIFSTWNKIFNYHRPKISSLTYIRFSLHESECIHIRAFWSAIPRIYETWLSVTCVYLFFLHFESLNYDLSSEWVAIKDNMCVIMPTISPFGLDGNPKSLKVTLPLSHQVQRVMHPLSSCWNLCSAVLSMLPLTIGKVCRKMFYKKIHNFIHHKWPSYHQRLIYTSISQPSGNWLIHPTKWGYTKSLHKIKQEHYIIHPRHSGEIKEGHYMTLIRKEIHDMEMKYLQPDYDSYQQLSSATSVNNIQTSNLYMSITISQNIINLCQSMSAYITSSSWSHQDQLASFPYHNLPWIN